MEKIRNHHHNPCVLCTTVSPDARVVELPAKYVRENNDSRGRISVLLRCVDVKPSKRGHTALLRSAFYCAYDTESMAAGYKHAGYGSH